MSASMEVRVARLEEQVAYLAGGRPGRKPKPIVVSEDRRLRHRPGA